MAREEYGARIERGTITEIIGTTARVQSVERDGYITLPLAIPAGLVLTVGDKVTMCEYADGDGDIIALRGARQEG